MAKAATPPLKRGKIPSSSTFRIVKEASIPDLVFGASKGRESVYLKALQELLDTPGTLMEVDSPTARSGIAAQAKKNGIAILFGERGGKLYVKAMSKESAEEFLLKQLQLGPMTMVEITAVLAKPHPEVKVSDIVKTLAESGKIVLRGASGPQSVKKWHLV